MDGPGVRPARGRLARPGSHNRLGKEWWNTHAPCCWVSLCVELTGAWKERCPARAAPQPTAMGATCDCGNASPRRVGMQPGSELDISGYGTRGG